MASAAALGRRSGGSDTGSGPRLALQESLRRRSESSTSDWLPPLPPGSSNRPASAASQYSLEAQSFHSTGSRAGQRRPSVRRSASAASIPSSHSSLVDTVLGQVGNAWLHGGEVAGWWQLGLVRSARGWWPAVQRGLPLAAMS